MKDMDMFGDICRIEEDKSELLTSVARLFELLTEKEQETGRIKEGLSEIVASAFTLGHDLGLSYEAMYAQVNETMKVRTLVGKSRV